MFRDLSFGQYYPASSFLHSLDPRTKIVLTIFYIVGIFFVQSFVQFGIVLLFLTIAVAASRVPLKSVLKSVKGILFLVIFTCVLNIFFVKSGTILVEWWIIRITDQGLYFAAKMALRLLLIVIGASLLTFTTPPVVLTNGIEKLLSPLAVVHFPVHEFALIMSITLRFIPVLTEETDRIVCAQKARGADFDTGNLLQRAKAFVPILIPLLIGALRRADELALAMDSRCYHGGKGCTKMKVLKFGLRDVVATFVILVAFVSIFLMNYFYAELYPQFPWLFL